MVFRTVAFLVQNTIVSGKFYFAWNVCRDVVYKYKEEEGAKNWALGDSRCATGMLSDFTCSKITNCERSYRKPCIQFVRFPVPIILLSFAISLLWHTESNALEKSSSIKSVCERLLIERARSCTTSVSYVVDSPFRNPCWLGDKVHLDSRNNVICFRMMCSSILHDVLVNESGLQLDLRCRLF